MVPKRENKSGGVAGCDAKYSHKKTEAPRFLMRDASVFYAIWRFGFSFNGDL